ncbi:hypothetical protein [Streptomyces cinnamoneus]|uniref:hypothetical protein n=1 Tax=Streptomyces cinnamoneus TaxID=53446 RepID=UPI0037885C02
MSGGKGKKPEDGAPGQVPGAPAGPGEAARRAEERFIDDLIARGEAVPEGEELPPGATHVVVHEPDGRRTLRRMRFSGG